MAAAEGGGKVDAADAEEMGDRMGGFAAHFTHVHSFSAPPFRSSPLLLCVACPLLTRALHPPHCTLTSAFVSAPHEGEQNHLHVSDESWKPEEAEGTNSL